MPHIFDFNKLSNVKQIRLKLEGWIDPLFVEYGIGQYKDLNSYFWRVKGTNHTFVIPTTRINYLSSGNYDTHFKKVLSVFRQDYMEWKANNFSADWMQEYRKEFGQHIIT